MIAEEIKSALARKRWSIARAAKESGVERTFLSRLVNGLPPPRTKKGRQAAEIDPRYRRLAEALCLPNPDAFIQEVMDAQSGPSTTETLSKGQKRFLAYLLGSLREVPIEHKANITALLNQCVRAGNSYQGIPRLRRLILSQLESELPISGPSSPSSSQAFIGQRDHRPDRSDLSELLERIGDQTCSVQEDYAIDSQFEVAQILFELSRLAVFEPTVLSKATEIAQQAKLKRSQGI